METYATRECAANVDAHYLINNTNVMTATVTARKHRGINNSMNKNNSEGVHTQNMGLFVRGNQDRSAITPTSTGQLERTRSSGRSQAKIEYMKTNDLRLQYYNDKATSGPAFIIERKAPSDLKRLKRMVPQEMRTKTEITPRNTRAPITFAKPFPRAGPIPIVPDNMQVGEELVRRKMHTFRLPSLEVPIQVCLRAKVPHIHAQPSKVRGAVLVATITARITSIIPPTFHSCETAARTMTCLDLNERHNELHKLI